MKDMSHENQEEGLKPGKLLHLNTMLHVNWSCVTTSSYRLNITLTAYKCTQNGEQKLSGCGCLISVLYYISFFTLFCQRREIGRSVLSPSACGESCGPGHVCYMCVPCVTPKDGGPKLPSPSDGHFVCILRRFLKVGVKRVRGHRLQLHNMGA